MSTDPKPTSFFDAVKRIRNRDRRYAPEAYALVMDSVAYAIQTKRIHAWLYVPPEVEGLSASDDQRHEVVLFHERKNFIRQI